MSVTIATLMSELKKKDKETEKQKEIWERQELQRKKIEEQRDAEKKKESDKRDAEFEALKKQFADLSAMLHNGNNLAASGTTSTGFTAPNTSLQRGSKRGAGATTSSSPSRSSPATPTTDKHGRKLKKTAGATTSSSPTRSSPATPTTDKHGHKLKKTAGATTFIPPYDVNELQKAMDYIKLHHSSAVPSSITASPKKEVYTRVTKKLALAVPVDDGDEDGSGM